MAHDEFPVDKFNVARVQFDDFGVVEPATIPPFSGALYSSGGGLYYMGSAGSVTKLAVA